MNIRSTLFIITLALLAACQPNASSVPAIELTPFPTMTVGQVVRGELGTPGVQPEVNALPNPATAVALANRPTATPDRSECPTSNDDAQLVDFPATRQAAIDALLAYLNAGGNLEDLQERLITEWDAFGNRGYFRTEVDLTGEDEGELVMGYIAPGDVGTLLIFGCDNGRYLLHYEAIADGVDPPRLIWLGDINNNPEGEVVFARRLCTNAEFCEFQTQILTWDVRSGRFVNLLDESLLTLELPELRDIDNDQVDELVISLDSSGTSETGPLRTGVNVYDWDGSIYDLSYFELDPPRYHIELVHEGDKFFSRLEMADAIDLYERALADEDLRYWFNDGPTTVDSYALYRLVLAYALESRSTDMADALARLTEGFVLDEEGEIPVYVTLAQLFTDTLTITNNLNAACEEVRNFIAEDDEALTLLNRYGSRSPTYTALDLCPY